MLITDCMLKMPMFFRYSVNGVFLWIVVMIMLATLASLWPALRALERARHAGL
jgi:ABC-type lipoprotein release transport system permease subunit